MYLTIVYIVLTNEPPTEKPRAFNPEPDLVLVSPKSKTKTHPYIDSDSDVDVDVDADSDAMLTRKKADKGRAKAIDG